MRVLLASGLNDRRHKKLETEPTERHCKDHEHGRHDDFHEADAPMPFCMGILDALRVVHGERFNRNSG